MTRPKRQQAKQVTIKAWAIVIEDFIVSDNPIHESNSPLAIFRTRAIARKNTLVHKVVPVTITFSV